MAQVIRPQDIKKFSSSTWQKTFEKKLASALPNTKKTIGIWAKLIVHLSNIKNPFAWEYFSAEDYITYQKGQRGGDRKYDHMEINVMLITVYHDFKHAGLIKVINSDITHCSFKATPEFVALLKKFL